MSWTLPARRRQSQTGANTFLFLNTPGTLAGCGWDDAAVPMLWRYNLHYFDDLNAEGAAARAHWHGYLIQRWMAENPPAQGVGWDPYPTSLRIVNWIKWARAGNTLPSAALDSLAIQTRWVQRRLERHLLGNHLFANAKALVFAGCFFAGEEASRWLQQGLDILTREIPEQILSDGGHFELSPMYHALALEDMLDLVNILRGSGVDIPASWHDIIDAMRAWLRTMSHPDGEISFFNDAAIGIAPAPAELERYASDLGFGQLSSPSGSLTWLQDSGYIRLEDEHAVVLIDVARIGPDYIPGHAHADTLTFEMSVHGQRAIVNSGTSEYGSDPERLRQRGTTAHNTVVIDGENSSEVWSGFRVARRAYPQDVSVTQDGETWVITGAHNGYTRLAGRPIHHRTWRFSAGHLTVQDLISGHYRHAAAAFHFHPQTTANLMACNSAGSLRYDQAKTDASLRQPLYFQLSGTRGRIEPSTWHPEFGKTFPCQKLISDVANHQSQIHFSWIE
ncbi:alginate lyase family protein [Hyphomicrobium sp. D-2]|uniref:heparinase II/III family protein n=1 Tax=Hyphomicrobium sp. D-2 TaxID=3041621 RepID=UPI002455DF13|nr:alginate lyase family protein [Hyphomicrobium sp. D-2]MDH4980674.1 alginate lyase family protein [Hyphomicrobium sp. D-2]